MFVKYTLPAQDMCQHSAQRLGRHLRQHPPEHLQISHALQRCNGRGRALRVRAILRRWSQRRSHHGRDASRALRRQGKSARVSTKARADPREPRQQGALDLALTHPPIHSQPNVPNFLQVCSFGFLSWCFCLRVTKYCCMLQQSSYL